MDENKNIIDEIKKVAGAAVDGSTNDQEEAAPEEAEKPVLMEYKLRCKILFAGGGEEDFAGKATVDDAALHILPDGGARLDTTFRDIKSAIAEDYKVTLELKGGGSLVVYFLGKQYDFFVGDFIRKYNATVKKDTFMSEKAALAAKGAKYKSTGGRAGEGICDVYIGDTAVILEVKNGPVYRMPFALIDNPAKSTYGFSFSLAGQETWEIFFLGKALDPTWKMFNDTYAKLLEPISNAIKEMVPGITPLNLRRAAQLFCDGRSVHKNDIEQVDRKLWNALLKKVEEWGGGEYFTHILSQAGEGVRLGFKKPLLSSQEEYIWLMAAIKNSLILEAASLEGGGKATYVFAVDGDFNALMDRLNFCLHMVEFRREPIYMSDEQLQKPENISYATAVEKAPQLIPLRKLFKGRVAHTEGWKEGLDKLVNR